MGKIKQLQNIFKGDRIIWIIFFLLCLISVIEVYSSSSILGYKSGNYWKAAVYHSSLLLVGGAVMILVLNIPCKYFKALTPPAVIFSGFLLVLVYFIGTSANGAARWISVLGIPLQPSELAKGTLVLATAQILSSLQTPTGADKNAMKYIGIVALPFIALVFPENFSTAALMAAVVILMMFVGRVPLKQMGYLFSVIAILGIIAVSIVWGLGKSKEELIAENSPNKQMVEMADNGKAAEVEAEAAPRRYGFLHRLDTWKERIEDFGKPRPAPEDYDLDKDGQVGHANIAIASSDVIGVGPGNSVQRDFLPLAFSDFIYAIVIEEWGWFGAFAVAFLYIALLVRTGYIARNCQNAFPAYLAMGLAMLIVVQAVFNMMVAVGLAPVTGQPLPLISKGGTSSIINCAYIGVILSISRTAVKKDPKGIVCE